MALVQRGGARARSKRPSGKQWRVNSLPVLPVFGDGKHLVWLSWANYMDIAIIFARSAPNGDYRIDILAAS